MISSIPLTMPDAARLPTRGILLKRGGSGRLGLDLVDVVGARCAVDGDPPRLHGFGDFSDQFDLEQAVVEARALHLDIVGKVELPPEMPGGDSSVEELAFGLFGFAA